MTNSEGFKLFGRSPTLWIPIITGAVILLSTFGFRWMTPDNATAINAVILALNGFAIALVVRPFQPAAFTGVISALVAAAAGYGFEFTPEQQAAVSAFGLAVISLLLYGNVSPIETAVTKASKNPTAEGAEHALHEEGYLDTDASEAQP